MQPLVSVLMTSYNRENYIGEAIESVLDSTYQNFELIIVDDCSKDNTVEIARTYAKADGRIQVYINSENLGDYPNRNRAAGYAKGEYMMYVDSDDTILKDGIEKCVAAMLQHPGSGFGLYGPADKFQPAQFHHLGSEEAIRTHFFTKKFLMIGPGGTIIKSEYFKKLNGYPEKYGPANDLYFNLKAAVSTTLTILPFEFQQYRYHAGQELNNTFSYLYNSYLYLKDALNELNLPLSAGEKKWISKKNDRRFFVNLVKYFFKYKSFEKVKIALTKTGFGLSNVYNAIFQLN